MALTVTTDLVVIHNADAGVWLTRELVECIQTEANAVEGGASQGRGDAGPGLQGLVSPVVTGFDIENTHLYVWLFSQNTLTAVGGVRIRVEQGANFGEWFFAGTVYYGQIGGWHQFVVDCNKPFDRHSATEPTTTAIDRIGYVMDTVNSGLDGSSTLIDISRRAELGLITVIGGAAVPRGSTEVAAIDKTNAWGIFQKVGGVYIVQGHIRIGDVTAAVASTFEDVNEVWVFADNLASAAANKIETVGGTGTNRITIGTTTGTGIDKEGAGGNFIGVGGIVPFRLEVIDADITTEFFGCNMLNPVLAVDDALRNFKVEDNSLATFTDDTRDMNDVDANDAPFFPATDAVNDSANFGHDERFSLLKINTGTAGVGTYTVTWEYSRSGGWTALTDVTDGTSNFKTTGLQTVSFTIPDDWIATAVDGDTKYWIRARRDAGTSTTNPLGTQAFCSMGGGARLEHTNAEFIRCNFTNFDVIRIRGSAKFKKCIVSDSVTPAKSAAIDLGPADPAVDTVRDITINGGINGVLLKGTGATTYNLRNFVFSGQTGKKIRVDFGAGDTVTINVVDGGTSLVAGDIDNVNASTVVINNATVTTLVNVKDNAAVNLQNARVILEAADGAGDLTFEAVVTITRVTTTATVAHTAHGMVNGNKVVIRGANEQEYNGVFTITNVSANAYDYTVAGSPATPATGTITESGVILSGLTDASGNISDTRTITLDTALKGFVRKASASPRFKSFTLAGTTDNLVGLTINVRLILDE